MITDERGRPIASDGPTGRQFNLVEKMSNGKRTWGIVIPSGAVELEADELVQVMGLMIHVLATQQRAHAATQKVNDVMQKLNKE